MTRIVCALLYLYRTLRVSTRSSLSRNMALGGLRLRLVHIRPTDHTRTDLDRIVLVHAVCSSALTPLFALLSVNRLHSLKYRPPIHSARLCQPKTIRTFVFTMPCVVARRAFRSCSVCPKGASSQFLHGRKCACSAQAFLASFV